MEPIQHGTQHQKGEQWWQASAAFAGSLQLLAGKKDSSVLYRSISLLRVNERCAALCSLEASPSLSVCLSISSSFIFSPLFLYSISLILSDNHGSRVWPSGVMSFTAEGVLVVVHWFHSVDKSRLTEPTIQKFGICAFANINVAYKYIKWNQYHATTIGWKLSKWR